MFLDELCAAACQVMFDIDAGRRDLERGVEIIAIMVGEFAQERGANRDEVVRYVAEYVGKGYNDCAAEVASALRLQLEAAS